jgi:hypothetical protein
MLWLGQGRSEERGLLEILSLKLLGMGEKIVVVRGGALKISLGQLLFGS